MNMWIKLKTQSTYDGVFLTYFSQQPVQFETDKGGSSNKWEETAFQDNATQAKFRRLMGIKADESEGKTRR